MGSYSPCPPTSLLPTLHSPFPSKATSLMFLLLVRYHQIFCCAIATASGKDRYVSKVTQLFPPNSVVT
ncbi:hypothetical protein H1Q63_36930 [Desmonostoc muscorum CCALA 125]|nr:hypothetical protein [Desmonostoc muscorum CCALA 125]